MAKKLNLDNLTPFKKGESGNPKGKPKGTLNRSTIVKKWLESLVTANNPITGEESILPAQDQMTLSMIKKAIDGDVSAFRELMDSAFGKAPQSAPLDKEGNPTDPPVQLSDKLIEKFIDKL